MALVTCKECAKQISEDAEQCPNCGYKPKRTNLLTWIIGLFVVAVLIQRIGSPSHTTSAQSVSAKSVPAKTAEQRAATAKQDAAVRLAAAGAVLLKKSMRNPDSFKLESALVINGTNAVCYDYRAQNGFGGMNVGHAVVSSDGAQFQTTEMDGFYQLWNKECANKSGQEVATAIRWFAL